MHAPVAMYAVSSGALKIVAFSMLDAESMFVSGPTYTFSSFGVF